MEAALLALIIIAGVAPRKHYRTAFFEILGRAIVLVANRGSKVYIVGSI
jgi:hypothetical protein